MVRAIYIVGPSATGKTTLCNALVERLRISSDCYITEVARKVMNRTSFTREHVAQLDMQRAILGATVGEDHLARLAAESQAGASSRMILSDRSAIDPVVYARMYDESGYQELIDSLEFRQVLNLYRQKTSLFILLGPVDEWREDDGVRSLEKQQECMTLFQTTLRELDVPFTVVGDSIKPLDERVGIVTRLL